MSKLSKAEQAIEARRKYQREWWRKNKSKKNAKKLEAIAEPDQETDPFLTILDAYVTLYNATSDTQIKADANKLLASILPKL